MRLLGRISHQSIFLCICAVYLAGFLAHAGYLGKTVYGDGTYYYGWLAMHPSKYSIGPALFWAPAYLLTHNQIVVGATSVLAVLFSLLLLWNLLAKYFGRTVGIMTVVAIAGASNLLFYGSLDVVNSHALTFFAATIFLTLLTGHRYWFAVGLSLGFLGLMRTQDLLFAVLIIPYVTKKNIFPVLFGTLIGFCPQIVAWYLATGRWFVSPYLTNLEGFNLFRPHILGVLFGIQNGLFLWTPVALIGTIGLIIGKRFWMLVVFILELYVVASWSIWWQGASYSGRMFVSVLPLLAFGVAVLFSRLSKYRFTQSYYLLAIIFPLTVLNTINIIYFLITLR